MVSGTKRKAGRGCLDLSGLIRSQAICPACGTLLDFGLKPASCLRPPEEDEDTAAAAPKTTIPNIPGRGGAGV